MAPKVADLVSNDPGKVVEVQYQIHEPVFFLLQRLCFRLGAELESARDHQLSINGVILEDEKKSLAEYRIYGGCLTYTFWDKYSRLLEMKTLTGKVIRLLCNQTESIAKIKERIQVHEGIPLVQQQLFYSGKHLEDDRVLGDYEIASGSTVYLVVRLRGGGGSQSAPSVRFADVSNSNSVHKIEFSESAPRGREVERGTNVECRCECTPRHNVICRKGFGTIELTKERFVCPNCNQSNRMVPVTVGFTNCQYRFMGIKSTGEQYTSKWVDVPPEDSYQLFNPSKQTNWRRLLIQSKPRGVKDDCVVCLSAMTGVGLKLYHCGHHFHEACYAKVGWCVYCRFDMQLQDDLGAKPRVIPHPSH